MKLIKKITNDLQKLQELIDEQKQIDEQFKEAVRKFDKEKKMQQVRQKSLCVCNLDPTVHCR